MKTYTVAAILEDKSELAIIEVPSNKDVEEYLFTELDYSPSNTTYMGINSVSYIGSSFGKRYKELKNEALSYIKSHISDDQELSNYVDNEETVLFAQADSDVFEGSLYIRSIDNAIAHGTSEDFEDIDVELDDLSTETLVYIADQLTLGNIR